jgi:hypothetical protein
MTVPVVPASDDTDIEKLRASYLLVAPRGGDEADLAACSGLALETVERLLDQPGVAAQLEAARIKAEHEGKATVPLAQKIALKLLRRIDAEADTVDAAGAAELMRPVNRILENHDRVRLAEKDHYANLPVIHFTIGPAHAITTVVARAGTATELVQDVTPKAQPAPAVERSPVPGASDVLAALAAHVDPLPLEGAQDEPS